MLSENAFIVKKLNDLRVKFESIVTKSSDNIDIDFFADCQNRTIEIGNIIENKTDACIDIICKLEDICENIYVLSQGLDSGAVSILNDIFEKIDAVENEIADIKFDLRKKIVFFPYKFSMWDCMESVWEAAIKDDSVDAAVIPIPYYDKNSDGTLGEKHYEADSYPDIVNVCSYKEYQFNKECIDVAVVHNPYDDCNLVTSVDPFFYSDNLRNYAKKIVYIPYFNTGGAISDVHKYLPAYRNFDAIITQSELQSSTYSPLVRNKCAALGSPKFDTILNGTHKKILWKKRGKAFFYNTSISEILNGGARALDKMHFVFELFKGSTNTLLWRPHPLLESTIRTMKPELMEQFEANKKYFNNLKNGILDETSDPYSALAIADAYIGEDTSSMIHYFGAQGKPIFLTNINYQGDIVGEMANSKLFDLEIEGEEIWAFSGDYNALVNGKIDFNNKKIVIEKMYEIENEKINQNRLYNSMVDAENKIYLVPYNANEIAVFDKYSKKCKKIQFPNSDGKSFAKAHRYKNKIYFVPVESDAILEIDVESNEIVLYNEIMHILENINYPNMSVKSFNASVIIDDKMYIGLAFYNGVIVFDLLTKKMHLVKISDGATGYWCMEGWSDKIVLASNEGASLTVWNPIDNTASILSEFPSEWKGETNCFYTMVKQEDSVIIFPKTANLLLEVTHNDNCISHRYIENESYFTNRKTSYYKWPSNVLFANKYEDGFVIQMAFQYGIDIINNTGECNHIDFKMDDLKQLYPIEKLFGCCGPNIPWAVRESSIVKLNDFIEYVSLDKHNFHKEKEAYAACSVNLDGTCGSKIFKYIMEME